VSNAFGTPLARRKSFRYAGARSIQMTASWSGELATPCLPPITWPSSLKAFASVMIWTGADFRPGAGRHCVPPLGVQIQALWSEGWSVGIAGRR
jgi:hypothetical protein